MYKIPIQYTNPFKRYRMETICVTYGTDGQDLRDGQQWYYMQPHCKWRGHKKIYSSGTDDDLGPVVQSIVSLTSVVKILTVLVSTISNSQVFFQQKYKCICYIYDQKRGDNRFYTIKRCTVTRRTFLLAGFKFVIIKSEVLTAQPLHFSSPDLDTCFTKIYWTFFFILKNIWCRNLLAKKSNKSQKNIFLWRNKKK